jgi:hypothetical protein
MPGYVRLKAHSNSGVRVPDLADTVGPVIESNCAGAITPGGEQLEMNHQSVTRVPNEGTKVNSFRSADLASLHSSGEAQNKIRLPAQREWIAAGRDPKMIGDGMVGSSSDVNQGTTAGGERAGRGQSLRSSEETSNDRGAKGGKNVVWVREGMFSQKGQHSAARLSVLVLGKPQPNIPRRTHSEPPSRVSEARACAAGTTLPIALSCQPEPVHRLVVHELESRMRENRQSGLGGGRRFESVLYPHSQFSLRERSPGNVQTRARVCDAQHIRT